MSGGDAFETERLRVRPLGAADLPDFLGVYTSNGDYLALTEGSGCEAGRYDLDRLQRDFAVAQLAGRHLAGIVLTRTGEPIGVLEWIERHPSDGKPWLGLLMIRDDRKRVGFGSEAFDGFAAMLRDRGCSVVRAAVIERSDPARAFAQRLGFTPVARTVRRLTAEREDVVVVERAL